VESFLVFRGANSILQSPPKMNPVDWKLAQQVQQTIWGLPVTANYPQVQTAVQEIERVHLGPTWFPANANITIISY
jgi:hypothetical protein